MERKVIETGDGSYTLELSGVEETYHSRHGAVQESAHVFIESGLMKVLETQQTIRILEVGFGTGLNALLTRAKIEGTDVKVRYSTLETAPLGIDELNLLGYGQRLEGFESFYLQMHSVKWEEEVEIDDQFSIIKYQCALQEFQSTEQFDLIYFDAFGPRTQPELWSLGLFKKLADMTIEGGVFVTYCAKGQARRDLSAAGYTMERLAGPPGKRHMLRGTKS